MRRVLVAVVLGSAVGIATGSVDVSLPAQQTLTTIDSVPTRAQLDDAFPTNPLQSLQTIATDADTGIGIRIRAIRALPKYCTPCADTDAAHQTVTTLVAQTANATQDNPVGSNVLLLRAGIEALGAMGVKSDVTQLVPLLDHGSRDIRAATARALRDLCNPTADPPLRVRFSKEQTEQVRLAISEALRVLTTCGG